MTSTLSLVHQENYDPQSIHRAVRRAVDLLGGIDRFVRPKERILLKPNLLSPALPEKAITTHPAIVGAVIELVREAGGEPVIGDSPGIASLAKAAERAGILGVAHRAKVELIDFDQPQEVEVPPGFRFKRIEVARAALEVDGIINLPKLKTHGQMTLTLCIKNMFGCIPGARKAQWHLQASRDLDRFAEMLMELYLQVKPRLSILDGILGMEGDGPGNSGTPRWMHILAASGDGIALDRAMADLLGIPWARVPILRIAQQRGLLSQEPSPYRIKGEPLGALAPAGFVPPRSFDLGWGIPPSLHTVLRKALTARPRIDSHRCTLCQACREACPAGAIGEKEGRLTIDLDECIHCFCCQELCPQGAVEIRPGWASRWLGARR